MMDINYILMLHGQIREKKKPKIYGVSIDLENSNGTSAVRYTDDAITMLAGTPWDSVYPFNEITPVLLDANGVETAQLDKNDFSKNINGDTVNITSGDNVMIKIPKVWYKIETIGDILYCKISSEQVDETYKCYAHSDGFTERDAFYIGAYLSYEDNNVLKSWSGRLPANSINLVNSRIRARANGFRYNLLGFYQLTLLQLLMVIRAKSITGYTTYGVGYVDGTERQSTGITNDKGMYAGSRLETEHVKILGIEDYYGNLRYWIDGIKSDDAFNLLTTKNPSLFDNSAYGYEMYETPNTESVNSYIKTVQGDTEKGFVIKDGGASSSTYFAGNGQLYASSYAVFGSTYESGGAGIFNLRLNNSSGSSSSSTGVRLMYL